MSFNPVGTWVPPAAMEEPIGAFEVSKGRRICKKGSEHVSTPTVILINYSAGCACRHLLSVRRWSRFWICRDQTGLG